MLLLCAHFSCPGTAFFPSVGEVSALLAHSSFFSLLLRVGEGLDYTRLIAL